MSLTEEFVKLGVVKKGKFVLKSGQISNYYVDIKKMIDGYVPTKKDKVVIVDDVFKAGTCMLNVARILRKTNTKILSGCVVVSRGDTPKLKIPIKHVFNINKPL